MPKLSPDQLSQLIQAQEARKANLREHIRQAVSAGPAPLSRDLTDAVIRLFGEDVRAIMQGHPGFSLFEKRASYRISRSIFDICCADLFDAINTFSARALSEGSPLFDNPYGEAELHHFEQKIQKELFATANAAASLVDHSRIVRNALKLSNYSEQQARHFGADGLHEFIIALRILLHHVHIVEAAWHLDFDFEAKTKSASFVIGKNTLLRLIPKHDLGKTALLVQFVNKQSKDINLKALFEEYTARVKLFHEWLEQQLQSEALVSLHDYDRIMREKKHFDLRMWWNAMLVNWLRNWRIPPNPHNHLQKYLTDEQIARVYTLPRNSKDQVDLVIEFLDKDHAIDDKLRALAYELFERSPSAEDVPLRADLPTGR